MDFLGMVSTIDQKFELYRVGYQLQRIFVKEELVAPTIMHFSQDGRFIVLGYKDGKVSMLKCDNQIDDIFTTKMLDEGFPITAINIR